MRRRITLACALALALSVAACCALLLAQSGRTILALSVRQAQQRQRNLQASFAQMADYFLDGDESAAARFSLLRYCFAQLADETSVLLIDGETAFTSVAVAPEALLPLSAHAAEPAVYTGEALGRDILIAGDTAEIAGRRCAVYVVQDVSAVRGEIAGMGVRFAVICLFGALSGALLTALLVRWSARPLAQLGAATRRIAQGEYGERVAVRGGDEVARLAEDFNAMADAVQRRVAALTETAERQRLFIGAAAHEFRTPLTGMLLHLDALRHMRLSEGERLRALAHVERQCSRLERLTHKLLTLVTLHGTIRTQPVPAAQLFDRVRACTQQCMAGRGTALHTVCGSETYAADADLMESLLINLVENAAKASQPGQTVRLSARGPVIEVRDDGCGMAQEELPRVCAPFYRIDRSRSRKSGGAGLGLALAQEIAAAHGAKLRIVSAPGEGTAVQVIFGNECVTRG